MAQNREIGELGQIVTVDTSANSLTVNGSIILGNSSSNVVINSTAISIGGITQTDRSFTWTNTHTFTNTVSIAALSANGTLGLSSQVLTTNGSGIYWSSAGVNVNATYTWSNVHTFNANLILSTATAISANGSYGLSGQALVTNGTGVYWSSVATNTDSQYTWSNTQTFSNTITFSSVINGTANAANYLGNSSGTIANVSSWITSNAAAAYTNAVSYTDSKILTANSAITGNAATAYTNAVSYTDGKILTANAAITGNAATAYTNAVSYTDGKIATANSAITGNASTAYTNATIFASNASNINSGTIAEARLPYRMDQNVRTTDTITLGNLTLTGNLYVGSNVNVIGSNNLSIVDNMIYLNANNTVANPDLGFAGNYNDGTYHHAGFFRDASDAGTWKVFDNYLPEPDANSYIDTTNTTFHLANFQANTLNAGNTSTNWFIANTSGVYTTGVVNATSYIVGTAFTANSTVVNAVSYYSGTTLIGNTTGPYGKTEGNLNVNSALTSNNSTNLGGIAASGYQTTAGLSANVATLTANNSSYLGGTAAASYQLNSTLNANIASYLPTYTGVVNAASYNVGTSTIANSSGVYASVINASSGVYGTIQTATQGIIDHNSLSNYVANKHIDHTSVSVTAGNGLTGGGDISTTRTISVLANNGITANSTGLFVTQGTGAVVNATGVHVNSTYIGTLSANNTTYVNGKTEGNLNVNSATYATSAGSATNASAATNATYATSAGSATNATNASNLGGTASSGYALLSGSTFTGTIIGKTNNGGVLNLSNDSGSFSVRGDGTNAAGISFHRPGIYAVNLGLDTDNVFKIGGWSFGTPQAVVYNSGTWSININGSAGSATNATQFTTVNGSAPSYAIRCWVNLDQTGGSVRASQNLSSYTNQGGNVAQFNFSTAMSDANYGIACYGRDDNDDAIGCWIGGIGSEAYANTYKRVRATFSCREIGFLLSR